MDGGQGRPVDPQRLSPADLAVAPRAPILRPAAVAALCVGAMLQLWAPALLPVGIALAALGLATVALAFAAAGRSPRVARVVGPLAALLLGASACALHGTWAMGERLPEGLVGATTVLELRVAGLAERTPRGARFNADVIRVVDGAALPGAASLVDRRLALRWFGARALPRPGETWRLAVRFRALESAAGPGLGDAAKRALLDGVAGAGVVQPGVRPLRLGSGRGIDAMRDRIAARIAAALGPSRARFVAALAIGDTRGIADADWDWLRDFGLTHLVAISGFHVALVAGLGVVAVRALWALQPALGLFWRRSQAAAAAACGVAIAYAALAGFSLPTVRTVLMIGVVGWVAARRRRVAPAQGLLLAAALIVLLDPFALLTPGFWLSCGGVAWLLWCLPRSVSPWSARAFLGAQWVATLGLLPIAAAFFLQVPVAGPLANLVGIPWISLVVVPLSLAGVLLLPLGDALAAWPWAAASWAMDAFAAALAGVPASVSASRWIPLPSAAAVGLAVLGMAIVLLPRGLPWRWAGVGLLLPLLAPRGVFPTGDAIEVVALPLPRGDAVLLRTAAAILLVDAGPRDSGLVPMLRALGVDRIDLRIETRGNAGRAGGAAAVDAAFATRAVWRSPASDDAAAARCERGRRWSGGGVRLEALSPAPGLARTDAEAACVLRVAVGRHLDLWLSSDSGRWTAGRLAASADASRDRIVWGAPTTLVHWHALLDADAAIATRAPGPSLQRRWPSALRRVDREGMLHLRTSAGERADAAGGAPPVMGWRAAHRRWWHVAEAVPSDSPAGGGHRSG